MQLTAGTRPSKLALKQIDELKRLLPDVRFNIVAIRTRGDKDKTTPLPRTEGSDFFTHEIEQALLNGEIDIAVHSAKDLEEKTSRGLYIAAVTKSISPYDALISKDSLSLDELPLGAVVGTSSVNRQEAIKRYRGDLSVKDIRGNVDDRFRQLDNGDFDAIIVAYAALIRLGLIRRASQIIPFNIMRAHPMQGRLAIQVREERSDLKKLFEEINEK